MPAPRSEPHVIARADELLHGPSRRRFLRTLGAGGALVLLPSVFAACDDDDDLTGIDSEPTVNAVTLDLSNDVGILNFTYLNEQVETAFYETAVRSQAFAGMSAEEREVIGDIRQAEYVHREFLRAVLGSARVGRLALNASALQSLTASADAILRTSEMLEDNGVSALNGAGKYLQSAANLTLAGKLVSVEARHAAAVRELREARGVAAVGAAGTRFAGDDIVVPSGALAGLDVKQEVAGVLARVAATGIPAGTVTIAVPPPAKPGTPDLAPPMLS